MLQKLCVKYDNLIEVDNVAAVNRKIDSVKLVMLDNIGEALKNTEKIDLLNEQAQELSKQSGVFRDGAKELKNKMWWKNMKVMIILFIINIAILVCFYLLYNNNFIDETYYRWNYKFSINDSHYLCSLYSKWWNQL